MSETDPMMEVDFHTTVDESGNVFISDYRNGGVTLRMMRQPDGEYSVLGPRYIAQSVGGRAEFGYLLDKAAKHQYYDL